MVINENVKRKVIPIGGGKGGVGKTFIAANLSIALAKNGKDTIVIDLDLGGSNLHTFLGMKNTHSGIGNFLSRKRGSFSDLIVETHYENLKFIPGDVLVSGLSNILFSQKKKLVDNILELDTDYIIIDLGSGSHFTVIDLFLISNSGFVITTPQTTSVLNAYGFLKNLLFRFFQRAFATQKEVTKYLKSTVMEKKPGSAMPFIDIVQKIRKIDRESGNKAKKYLAILQPKVIINNVKSPDDLLIIEKLRDLSLESLNLDVECMGMIYSDKIVEKSLSETTPLMIFDEDSIVAKDIERIALKIIQSDKFPRMPLDLSYYKDSFELTQIEAQNDYAEIENARQDEENIDIGEFITIISAQRKKINELQGIIRMLTMEKE
jgi:flagellar biosynthesis protein FlhG